MSTAFARASTLVPPLLPPLAIEALFGAAADEPAVYWASGDRTMLGLGAVWQARASGTERFSLLREAARTLPAWARVFAGFAFLPTGSEAMPDAWAVLPRVLVAATASALRVTLVGPDGLVSKAALAETMAGLERAQATSAAYAPEQVQDASAADRAFCGLVDEARAQIAARRASTRWSCTRRRTSRSTTPRRRAGARRSLAQRKPNDDALRVSRRRTGIPRRDAGAPRARVRPARPHRRARRLAPARPTSATHAAPAAEEREEHRAEHEGSRATRSPPCCARIAPRCAARARGCARCRTSFICIPRSAAAFVARRTCSSSSTRSTRRRPSVACRALRALRLSRYARA